MIAGGGDLPLIVVPHTSTAKVPFGQWAMPGVVHLADMILDEVEFSLVGAAAEVARRYHERVEGFSTTATSIEV